jgi:hypothetical protein
MKHADKKTGEKTGEKVLKALKAHASKPASKAHKGLAKGGGVKIRGCGAATKGCTARGPMA